MALVCSVSPWDCLVLKTVDTQTNTTMSVKPNKGFRYPDSFKQRVIQEVLSGKVTKDEAKRKYGIGGKTTVLKWLRRYGYSEVIPGSVTLEFMEDPKEQARLKARIKQLEAQLEEVEMKAALYERMIEIAEERFGLDIEKKSVTKQSKKSRK